jgi:glycosyltransferase involved in cell wall biosynthesis
MPSDVARSRTAAPSRGPLRVVLVNNFYPPYVVGGAEIVVANLARELVATGVDVTVVTTCGPQEGLREEVVDGVHVVRFFPQNLWWNYDRFRSGDARSLAAKALWNLRDGWNVDAARKFGAVLDQFAPDLVHTHNIKGMSPSLWAAARRRGLPVVHTMHDYYLICARGTMLDRNGKSCEKRCLGCRVYGQWYRPLVSSVDLLCSPSRYLLDVHEREGVRARLGQRVVRNGLPRPAWSVPPRADGKLRLLFLGQLRREKGIQVLLEAMRRVRRPVEVHVAGRGDMAAEVRQTAAADPRLIFHGFLSGDEKQRELDLCDATLFPSIWAENAPLSISEAFLNGRPVIGSRFGAIPEFVTHGGNGLLFEMGDPTALAAAIDRLAADDGLLRSLAAGATDSAAACTAQAMTAGYRGLYELALENRRVVA